MDANDTETLIALVSSLLKGSLPAVQVILDALVTCDGNVEAAAEHINSSRKTIGSKPASKKRKSTGDLDGWLKPPKAARAEDARANKPRSEAQNTQGTGVASSSKRSLNAVESFRAVNQRSPSPLKSALPSKPVVDLMSVLRQAPAAPQSLPKVPPLTLSNPFLVAQHTPCTLHLSVLPPELACRLFYTMINASADWKKNKWWLFDRVVESPHRTSFYARKSNGVDNDEGWQEAAQFWLAELLQ